MSKYLEDIEQIKNELSIISGSITRLSDAFHLTGNEKLGSNLKNLSEQLLNSRMKLDRVINKEFNNSDHAKNTSGMIEVPSKPTEGQFIQIWSYGGNVWSSTLMKKKGKCYIFNEKKEKFQIRDSIDNPSVKYRYFVAT